MFVSIVPALECDNLHFTEGHAEVQRAFGTSPQDQSSTGTRNQVCGVSAQYLARLGPAPGVWAYAVLFCVLWTFSSRLDRRAAEFMTGGQVDGGGSAGQVPPV